jgi:hypothetical protein
VNSGIVLLFHPNFILKSTVRYGRYRIYLFASVTDIMKAQEKVIYFFM